MAAPSFQPNRRILIIDDNTSIHTDFKKILGGQTEAEASLESFGAEMFGENPAARPTAAFQLASAYQGQEGLAAVQQALAAGRPFALAFVDVRMPPGWDGIETVARIWEVDPDLEIVICTAYSDHSWEEITTRLGGSDKLVILKKPFDVVEVLQLAHALTRKWSLSQESKHHLKELDQRIQERTRELRESETRYSSLFENMLEGFAYCRMIFEDGRPTDFVYLEVNRAFEHLTGLKDVVGKKISELVPGIPQAHPELFEKYGRVASSGQPERFEVRLDRLRIWLAVSAYSPSPGHFIAVFDNITERKEAELRLAAFASLDHKLGAAKSTGEAAQIIVNVADESIGWDACLCDLYSAAENLVSHVLTIDIVGGRRAACPAPPSNLCPPSPLAKKAIQNGSQLVLRREPDVPSGETVPFGDLSRPSASLLYVPIRNGPAVIGLLSIQSYTVDAYDAHDLALLQSLADRCGAAMERIRTEESLRQTQEQLRHSQKLEAIGQLAGGVAHDFNNLLSVIRGNIELVLMEPGRFNEETTASLKLTVAAADRAANLTRQLLAFSRKQVMQSRPLNLNSVIANLTKMLKRLIGEHIQLKCLYATNPPFVRADVGMFEQVLVNLVVNARDAMAKGGEMLLSTEVVTLDRAYALAHPDARAGDFVCCSVQDTGVGISAENLPHIFEPFFTTKEVGKGTGLGLSTVYGIVKQHSGWVEVSSQAGVGSVFKVFLPVVEPSAAEKEPHPGVALNAHVGTETILLVEDEDAVRSVARRFLLRSGYSVVEAVSGREALDLWRQRTREIDLVVTDLMMPGGVSGADLAKQLWTERPRLKVIFVSGYSSNVAGKEAELFRPGQSRFLQKPCPPTEFLSAVRECLDEPLG
jgi:PAS domain S-box-containing protein